MLNRGKWTLIILIAILAGALVLGGCSFGKVDGAGGKGGSDSAQDPLTDESQVEDEIEDILAYISQEQVPLRQGAGGHQPLLTYLTLGDEVVLLAEEENRWTQVSFREQIGYVFSEYLQEENPLQLAEELEEEVDEETKQDEQNGEDRQDEVSTGPKYEYEHVPKLDYPDNPRVVAKGVYVTKNVAAGGPKWERIMKIVDETEVNSLVIDMKNDFGLLLFPTEIELAQEVGADKAVGIRDGQAYMKGLDDLGIYTIARIVVFRDPLLAEKRPDLALKRKDGSLYSVKNNMYWVNPYDKGNWDYNIAIAKEAAKLGFREIQFDYVRFPEGGRRLDPLLNYEFMDGRSKHEAITQFLAYARQELEPLQVYVSADVFGLATTTVDDMGIGHLWEPLTNVVDYISPMTYPSHYGPGLYGYQNPNANPYGVLDRAIKDGLKRNEGVLDGAMIRPWLQDFSLGRPKYGPEQVRQQIQALEDNGIEEWLLWNAANNYSVDALKPAK